VVARETPDGRLVRWKGAGCIPASGVGYWSATTPLVLLELDRRGLTVRMRPALFGRFVGARVLTASPGDGLEIRLVRNGGSWQGIEFRPPRRSSFYFYTRHRGIVLNALAEAGFTVSSEPGRERPAWYQPDDD
jgi:hypothetical protein